MKMSMNKQNFLSHNFEFRSPFAGEVLFLNSDKNYSSMVSNPNASVKDVHGNILGVLY